MQADAPLGTQTRTQAGAAIEICGLAHRYADGTPALRGVDLRVAPGEALAVVGANGAGKSTLLLHLNGLLLPGGGSVRVADLLIEHGTRGGRNGASPGALRELRRRVGFVFQDADDQLFMPTVQEDVAFGPLNLGLPAPQVQRRVQDALAAVGAASLAGRCTHRLSGGEKRAVALAGVLAMTPSVLVLDEPSAGLDPAGRRSLIELLRGLPLTRIVATHDLLLALELCPRVVMLHEGRVLADGPTQALFADEELLRRCHLELPRVTATAAVGLR
jgi:cobalt/nickel transport system ATP-binding protein